MNKSDLYNTGKRYKRKKEFKKAFHCFSEAVLRYNDGEALKELGTMYMDGIYVEENAPKACSYFEIAYETGSVMRSSDFLMMASYRHFDVERGRAYGLSKNMQLAIKWYEESIDTCTFYNDLGYASLGQAYLEPECQDYQKAYYYLKKGEANDKAQYYLGYMHENGFYVKQDGSTAIQHYRKAIEIVLNKGGGVGDLFYDLSVERLMMMGEPVIHFTYNTTYMKWNSNRSPRHLTSRLKRPL